ncbi:MAG: EamA family transporter [Spirochaetota bacterium]
MIKYTLIVFGIIFSATAQVMIKKSSFWGIKDFSFYLFFSLAGICYILSFGLYAYILKYFALSKISPIMTIGTMILVIGSSILLFKETITLKQSIGIFLGIFSIYLLLG